MTAGVGRRARRVAAILGALAVVLTVVSVRYPVGASQAAPSARSEDTDTRVTGPADPASISAAAADRDAQMVAGEDRRIQDLRTISTLARWQNRAQRAPYRVGTAGGFTLVLTARSEPYVLSDLLALAPQTLVRLSDGSFLLSEHLLVLSGAVLNLSSPGLVLRLASSPSGFVSIVSFGGRIIMVGTVQRPIHVTSWDTRLAAEDTVTEDGRAYLRAIGGQAQLSYVDIDDLGFWSGRTGGVALTGTDRPNTGSLRPDAAKTASRTASVGGLQVLPTGALPVGAPATNDADIYTETFVAARIDHVTVTGNAFGLFVSGADGVLVSDSTFRRSQITGVDLHRFVTSSTIQRTVSDSSGGNGFSLGRATQGVQIVQSSARGNANDGFVISGSPLADGPSAVGSPTTTYGNNLLSNSVAEHNGHYGVHVKDGFNMTVSGNRVTHSPMGIVASDGAHDVSINGNQVSRVSSHGIALVKGVSASTVAGNVVTGAPIYLRGSSAAVRGNTVLAAQGHAISVVGFGGGTDITNNVTSGSGSSAIDVARSSGSVTASGNSLQGWHDTTSLLVRSFHMMLHPMSLLWATILALILLSMVKGLRRRHIEPGTNPYAHQSKHLLGATA